MTARPATADLFGLPEIGHVPADVTRGLATLATGAPLWPVGRDRWAAMVTAIQAFAAVHDARARSCGWSSLSLYGLHHAAPYANLAAMGAAWVVARSGHRVAAVAADSILLVAPTGSRLRIYRGDDQGSVVAWDLCRH
jgi:hypothetical protein